MSRAPMVDVDATLQWVAASTNPDLAPYLVSAEEHKKDADGFHQILADEVRALRNELEYERNLRKAAQVDTEELSAQLSASAEVLP